LSKLPNFYGAEQIRERFASIGCEVKDIHVPPSFNEAGKRRKNSRGFAYVEFETKDAMRKAFTSVGLE
jgi:RNA recognition motif-containing protein